MAGKSGRPNSAQASDDLTNTDVLLSLSSETGATSESTVQPVQFSLPSRHLSKVPGILTEVVRTAILSVAYV